MAKKSTSQKIDQALNLFKKGELNQAAKKFKAVLNQSPDNARALFYLGTIYRQWNDNSKAEKCLARALKINPEYTEARFNLANACKSLEKYDSAIEHYQKIVADQPTFARAEMNLGNALGRVGRFDEAVAAYKRAISIEPGLVEVSFNLGSTFLQMNRPSDAVIYLEKAAELRMDVPVVQCRLADTYKALNRNDDAVACYQKALSIAPGYVEAWNSLGNLYFNLERYDDAAGAYKKTVEHYPEAAEAHYNLANVLKLQGCFQEAVTHYHKAVAIKQEYPAVYNNLGNVYLEMGILDKAGIYYDLAIEQKPDYIDAYANKIRLHERCNQLDEAFSLYQYCQKYDTDHVDLALVGARIKNRQKDFSGALSLLKPLELSRKKWLRYQHVEYGYLAGEVLDRLSQPDSAFRHFESANRWMAGSAHSAKYDKNRCLAGLDELKGLFKSRRIQTWGRTVPGDGKKDPVFLVGFPRSGTTLLDTFLRGHPDIEVVEERQTFEAIIAFLRYHTDKGYPGAVEHLESVEIDRLRSLYFKELDKYVHPDKRGTIVDKLPLRLFHGGVIHRLFPNARFIFALRHPCDAVLSCFMQKFTPNDAMVNFYRLNDAARLYHRTMELWQLYLDRFKLNVYTVEYEQLLEDAEGVIKELLDFTGVEWDDRVLDFRRTAKGRSQINTPSYTQVTQPLYTHARYRWEKYRVHLAPVLPTLMPWAEHFGYREA